MIVFWLLYKLKKKKSAIWIYVPRIRCLMVFGGIILMESNENIKRVRKKIKENEAARAHKVDNKTLSLRKKHAHKWKQIMDEKKKMKISTGIKIIK